MQEFDPRRQAFRYAPRVLFSLAGCFVILLGARLQTAEAHLTGPEVRAADMARIANIQHIAFAEAETLPGMAMARNEDVEVQSGETFQGALLRLGVASSDANEVVDLLHEVFDTVRIQAGLRFQASVATPAREGDDARLIGLVMRTGPATQVAISRSYDGALRLREMTEEIREETTVVQGDINGAFYQAAADLGATSSITSEAVKLFGHKIDFSRDIRAGDNFKMVFTRRVTEGGRTIEGLNLLYAEITSDRAGGQPIRFYRYEQEDGTVEYFDEEGNSTRGFLMQTPVGFDRVTSSYGNRRHPVLGYNRMHTGIDFAGATGTPIYASGNGTVVMAGRNGGYGNWVQIRHGQGWETGYAHMSRFASGIRAGVAVQQGQLIGYVGSTGRVTGPHLHYEVMRNGRKVNPRSADIPAGGDELEGEQLAAFLVQAAGMDQQIAGITGAGQTRLAISDPVPASSRVIVAPPMQVSLRD